MICGMEKISKIIHDYTSFKNNEIHVAYCPERVLPGRIMIEISTNKRIIGGINDNSSSKIRKIYNLKGYTKEYRVRLAKSNSELCRLVSKQKVNIIFTTVGLNHQFQKINRDKIKNYVEIYVKSDIKTLIRKKKKIFYKKKTNLSLIFGATWEYDTAMPVRIGTLTK